MEYVVWTVTRDDGYVAVRDNFGRERWSGMSQDCGAKLADVMADRDLVERRLAQCTAELEKANTELEKLRDSLRQQEEE